MIRRKFLKFCAAGATAPFVFRRATATAPTNFSQKPILIFGGDGSHSITAEEVLRPYLKNKYGVDTLGNYFHYAINRFSIDEGAEVRSPHIEKSGIPTNAFRISYKDHGNGILRFRDYNADWTARINIEQLRKERLALLKKYEHHKYFLRITPETLDEETFAYLNERYTFLCMHRGDDLNQALTNHLKGRRGTFTRMNREPLSLGGSREINLKKKTLINKLDQVRAHNKFSHRIKEKIVIDSSTFDSLSSPHQILVQMGFLDAKNYVCKSDNFAAELAFSGDILKEYRNPQEIMAWYEEYLSTNGAKRSV